jgi:hypothetical protein
MSINKKTKFFCWAVAGFIALEPSYRLLAMDRDAPSQSFVESKMADQDKSRGKAFMHIPAIGSAATKAEEPERVIPKRRWRTEMELEPIARRVAENLPLMERFRAAAGSENED